MSKPETIGARPCTPTPPQRTKRKRRPTCVPATPSRRLQPAKPSRRPSTKGRTFPPHPYKVEEIVALLKANEVTSKYAGQNQRLTAQRDRALIVLLWRTGLRVSEALDLEERDLDAQDGMVTVRCGKGGKRRKVAMDAFGWHEVTAWLEVRASLQHGPVFCVIDRTERCGTRMDADTVRDKLHRLGKKAGLRRRCTPHNFRHTAAVEMWREGLDAYLIQQQLGHARLDVTASYLRGIDPHTVLTAVRERSAPVMTVSLIA